MKTITFTCETITPMFLSGADGSTPELRPPSIKGALRFWWRAMNGHLKLEDLKKQESLIFGGTDGDSGGRSRVIIRVIPKELETEDNMLVPHKTNMPKQKSFKPKQTFEVVLGLISEKEINLEKLQSLFEIVCLLGGFGKRVRRGMGSVSITKYKIGNENWTEYPKEINLDYILLLLNKFSSHYVIQNNAIFNNFSGRMGLYPWIKSIQIGKPKIDLTMLISKTTNLFHQNEKTRLAYEASLGHAFKGRFASPIYVSIIKGSEKPIITTLNTVPDRNREKVDKLLQENFKNKIL